MASSTMLDKAMLLPSVGYIMTRTLASVPGSLFRGKDGAENVLDHVTNTGMRTMLSTLTYGQLQMVLPAFDSTYTSWCKKNKHPVDLVDLPGTEAKGFWMGNKDAEYVMVFYHGGGFVIPGMEPHVDMVMRFVQWSNNKLAVFCVAYTLAPGKNYPTQINQAVEGLRYVLSLPNRSPSKTLLGGDSAGGNLVIAVLSHISGHPHPSVKPLEVSEKLFGGITIAPWVSSDDTKFASMRQFQDRDIIGPTHLHYWIGCYKGDKSVKDDEYITPEIANSSWWTDAKISSLLVTAGEHEALRDQIVSWTEKFQQGAPGVQVKFVIGQKETHDSPLLPKSETKMAGKEDSCQEAAIRAWIKTHLA